MSGVFIESGLLERAARAAAPAVLGLAVLCAGVGGASAQTMSAEQAQLLPALLAKPTDYDANFSYAKAAVAARDYEAAIVALERILFFNPNLSRAKYELGSLYFRLKSYEMAVRYFEEALATPGLEPDIRERIDVTMAAARKEMQPSRIYGVLQLGLGYNSNVPGSPSGFIRSFGADIPNPGPYYARGGASAVALGEIRHVYDFGNQRGDSWETKFSGIGSAQFGQGSLSSILFEASTGPRLALTPDALPGATVHPYVIASYGAMALGRLGSSVGGGVSVNVPIGAYVSVEPGMEWRKLNIAATSPLLEVASVQNTGSQWTASLAARWAATGRLTFDGKMLWGRNSSFTSALTSRRFGLEASARYEFDAPWSSIGWRWSASPFVRYAEIRFGAPDVFVDSLVTRVDRQWRVGAQLDMPISQMFGVAALIQYTRNNSSLPNYRSSAWSALVGPTLRF